MNKVCLRAKYVCLILNKKYVKRDDGYIECHHTKPVSELKPAKKQSYPLYLWFVQVAIK